MVIANLHAPQSCRARKRQRSNAAWAWSGRQIVSCNRCRQLIAGSGPSRIETSVSDTGAVPSLERCCVRVLVGLIMSESRG